MGYIGNAPYQGVLTGGNIQDGTVETTDLADGAVTTVKLGDNQVTVGKLASTLDLSGKTVTLPAGVGGHASGTEANRPASPDIGTIYFNTDEDTLQQYTSTGWKNIGLIPPAVASVSGTIYSGIANNFTISGSGFGVAAVVRFSYGGSSTDVSVTPDSDTQITVAVPSVVYNQSIGTSVTVSVIASGQVSNGVSKSVFGIPTGGTVTTSGGYRIHTITSSGDFVNPVSDLSVEYILVAGGGGSGTSHTGGGGGGAGGYLTGSVTLSAQTYPIVIGIGGPAANAGVTTDVPGTNGDNSTAFGLTAIGGGGGGAYEANNGVGNGGSGGGADYGAGASGGLGTSGQGNNGGSSGGSPAYGAGGGGGAGAPGANGTTASGGNGGVGRLDTWTGSERHLAGGGGGGVYTIASTLGAGGAGGGGNSQFYSGQPGGQNTGGGGGGNSNNSTNDPTGAGGAGGSGICIIRYQL